MPLPKENPVYSNITLSSIVEISERIREKKKEFERAGKKFIEFNRGEAGVRPPEALLVSLEKAIRAPKNQKYPKSGGESHTKNSIVNYLEDKGVKGLGEDNVIVTYGGQEALELVHHYFSDSNVLGLGSLWSCMKENILPWSSSHLMLSPFKIEDGEYQTDFKHLEDHLVNTNILYLNNPHNPTGKVFSREEVERIVDLSRRREVFIVEDAAYNELVFDGNRHVSVQEFDYENSFTAHTFSKMAQFPGLRFGFGVSRNKALIRKLALGNYTQNAGVVTFIQNGASAFLNNREEREKYFEQLRAHYQRSRDLLYGNLKDLSDSSIVKPGGAFYMFFPLGVDKDDSVILDAHLFNGVGVIPGTPFSRVNEYKGHIRISYSSIPYKDIPEGVSRIKKSVQNLKE